MKQHSLQTTGNLIYALEAHAAGFFLAGNTWLLGTQLSCVGVAKARFAYGELKF